MLNQQYLLLGECFLRRWNDLNHKNLYFSTVTEMEALYFDVSFHTWLVLWGGEWSGTYSSTTLHCQLFSFVAFGCGWVLYLVCLSFDQAVYSMGTWLFALGEEGLPLFYPEALFDFASLCLLCVSVSHEALQFLTAFKSGAFVHWESLVPRTQTSLRASGALS